MQPVIKEMPRFSQEAAVKTVKRTRWGKIRPYIEVLLFILFACLANAVVEILIRP